MPRRSWVTRTWQSTWGPAPIPRIGISTASDTALPTPEGTHSNTIEKHPAFSNSIASLISFAALSGVPPCTLNPPSEEAVCGVSPMCPITLIPAPTIALICGSISTPPSSLTQSQFVSLMRRTALATAISGVI
ncbi:hypothetical protein SDC9_207443 [bioreactor metagenome]|uniref:Uncharacterized protein n=1 Tax=bioreactor metagenome TaxID=1076179 RepID=A0A645J7X8_9ZZZZ